MKSTFTRDYKKFMEVLIAARNRQDLTRKNVAERLGKPQSFVSKYENSERRLDVIEFFQVAKALDENAIALFKEMELIE